MADAFHEVSLPLDLALGASGGPERRTEVVLLGSGREVRNQRWAASRRRWNLGSAVRGLADLAVIVAFFEARRGRLTGFRFRDPLDHSSAPPGATPAATDQVIGTGDGTRTSFALVKRYGSGAGAYDREIAKPVGGSVIVAVAGQPAALAGADPATGLVTLAIPPPAGAAVTAGFVFDVPVRFDTDHLAVDLTAFAAGAVPDIPLVEIRS